MSQVEDLDPTDEPRFLRWYEALNSASAAGRYAPVLVPMPAMRTMLASQERGQRRALGVFDEDGCHGRCIAGMGH